MTISVSQPILPASLPLLAREAWTPCWENLNKLDWVDGFSFTSYGLPLGVRVSDPALIPMLQKRLPVGARISSPDSVERYFSVILGGSEPGSRRRNYHLLYIDHANFGRSFKLDDVLDSFESWVRMTVAELAREHVFVHAGVVGWKGQGILIPGRTFTGKTSLVAELVKAGATYYSDEFAVLDEGGRVHPFLKPLSIRDAATARQREVPVEQIGGIPGSEPLPVGLVLVTEFKQGGRWRPRKLSPGLGALAMLENTICARRSPERSLRTLEKVVAGSLVIKSKRGEAAAVARAMLDLAERGRE